MSYIEVIERIERAPKIMVWDGATDPSCIPKALEAAERLKKGWSRQKHHTPPNEPHIRIVKVVTEMYIGEGE